MLRILKTTVCYVLSISTSLGTLNYIENDAFSLSMVDKKSAKLRFAYPPCRSFSI